MTLEDAKETWLRHTHTWNTRANQVHDPLFLEHPEFFDARDLVQVKYEMLRRVHLGGQTVTQTAPAFGFTRTAFYQAQGLWVTHGLIGFVPNRPGPRGPHKLSATVMNAAYATLAAHPDWHYRDLAAWIQDQYAITIHPRSLARALHDRNLR